MMNELNAKKVNRIQCFIPSDLWFCFPEWCSITSRTYLNGVEFGPDWFGRKIFNTNLGL